MYLLQPAAKELRVGNTTIWEQSATIDWDHSSVQGALR